MCGITALISDYKNGFTSDESNRFKILTWITQLRGNDSTGVVQVTTKQEVDSIKRLGPPQVLYNQDEFRTWDAKLIRTGKFAFSHCRAATKGTVTINNAHPFYAERPDSEPGITLIHNGTLHYQSYPPDYSKFDVDSQWLAHSIATLGAEKALSNIDGPIATMWYDAKDSSFNVYSNGERPLYYVETDGSGCVFNSEARNLEWMISGSNSKFGEIKPFPEREWWRFDAPDYSEATVVKIPKVVVKSSFPTYGEYEGYENWRDRPTHISPPGSVSSYMDDTRYFSLRRGMEEDFKLIWDGTIKRVDFERDFNMHCRATVRGNGHISKTYNTGPYEKGLLSIHPDPQDANIIIVQNITEEGTVAVRRFRKKTEPIPSGKVIDVPFGDGTGTGDRRGLAISGVRFRKGKTIHFTHKPPGGGKVKHKATCDADQPLWFNNYENDQDGAVAVGDLVFMEHFEVEENGKFRTVYGFRVYPEDKQDLHIEYIFHDARRSKQELLKYPLWQGRVNYIKINSIDRYNGSSNIIQVVLKDVQPVETTAKEETNEERAAALLH